jgi:hypothetical protein
MQNKPGKTHPRSGLNLIEAFDAGQSSDFVAAANCREHRHPPKFGPDSHREN